jgi:hypothetical protein
LSKRFAVPAMVLLMVLGMGCQSGPPKHVQNWDQLQVGMTRDEVTGFLGTPNLRVGPAQVSEEELAEVQDQLEGLPPEIGPMLDFLVFERWEYGRIELSDGILAPSGHTHILYFDRQGQLACWREPPEGAAVTTRAEP